jgi:hypothetical protein
MTIRVAHGFIVALLPVFQLNELASGLLSKDCWPLLACVLALTSIGLSTGLRDAIRLGG